MSGITSQITEVDIFKRRQEGDIHIWDTGHLVGRPFGLTYGKADILVPDAYKQRCGGIPQGCFLLAYYENEIDDPTTLEAILLRVVKPTGLPSDGAVISSMIEYYKDNIRTGSSSRSQIDDYTRYDFSFCGLECSVLGSFYKDTDNNLRFGADLENFYSAHNYSVIKPSCEILTYIVNYREKGVPGGPGDIRVGKVRYSSSRRYQQCEDDVPVYVQAPDFAGKRTALFGMTRTGKSNTVKKIIQACEEMSSQAPYVLGQSQEKADEILKPFTEGKNPKYPIGQIIFDINGEYANPNLQDQGTAIFDLYRDRTVRYSTIERGDGFKIMKVNFYKEVEAGYELIRSHPVISEDSAKYVSAFRNISLEKPDNYEQDRYGSEAKRYDRRVAAFLCCLYRAGFQPPQGFNVRFSANADVCAAVNPKVAFNRGSATLTLEQAAQWWERFWDVYGDAQCFKDYKDSEGHEWADEDLKAILVMLTRKQDPGKSATLAGYRMLKQITGQHTAVDQEPFDQDILKQLRQGRIVIVDLSIGETTVQRMFSERITRKIFQDSMSRFTSTKPNNFIQFYFEEAHNLFPKKEDKDLSQIYNRLAKEGAKLHLGLVYATQEVSSISSNILKATQNWFISHLNNDDEIRELRKYYDFSDFAESLIRFSQETDKGFIRMKTYSNAFVIPVQIDRFPPESLGGNQ